MKTDARLKLEVLAELRLDASLQAIRIGVRVRDGVAMLTGHLPGAAHIDAIERAVRRVAGVKAIAMEFDFEPVSQPGAQGAVAGEVFVERRRAVAPRHHA
jgi:osmotically-inducible protein OsmY